MNIKPGVGSALWMVPGAAVMLVFILVAGHFQKEQNPALQLAFEARRVDLVSRMQFALSSATEGAFVSIFILISIQYICIQTNLSYSIIGYGQFVKKKVGWSLRLSDIERSCLSRMCGSRRLPKADRSSGLTNWVSLRVASEWSMPKDHKPPFATRRANSVPKGHGPDFRSASPFGKRAVKEPGKARLQELP